MDMPNVIQKWFWCHVGPDRIKACHPLKRTGKNIPFFLKFVYFNDKNEIYEHRKQLAGQLNNGTQMYVNERLAKTSI